jgi:two-component system CheB/CheR fusion protein
LPFGTLPADRRGFSVEDLPMSPHDPAQPTPQLSESPEAAPPGLSFPVVGVGASAGGLESFTELLQNLPRYPGVAILYVSHLEPHHKSHLQEILAKVTGMPVHEVREGMSVQVDHLYLIPPNTNMALVDGTLGLTPRSLVRGQHMPIDHLFRSLANIQKDRSIAVVLSGGGTDGTLGFQAVKAEGGITIAQDEKTASQPSMPRSAVLDGSVDYVLSPTEIAHQIVRLVRHPYAKEAPSPEPAAVGDAVVEILTLLRSTTDVDFTHYKQTTVMRRIQRRLALRDCHGLDEYVALLRRDRDELNHLYQDLLIRVTQFFRDPEAFDLLKTKVFPALVQGRPATRPIRIWVAGCSTGEEVYSLAMALLEFLDGRPTQLPIKILATDLNEVALEKARTGSYVDNIEIDISPERLRRFFNRVDSHYQINKAIRELCIFSRHDLTRDPPFSNLDLVSCRNLLIYLDTALQKRVLPVLHYALAPDGYLFLGSSENVGAFSELFDSVDNRHRIFKKRQVGGGVHVALDFGTFSFREGRPRRAHGEEPPVWSALDVQREADRIVLARYAPVGVVVDETMTVLQFRGRTAPYLEPAPGLATLDLFRMLSEGMLAEVRAALSQARAENTTCVRQGLRSVDGLPVQPVQVEVIPFKVPPSGARFFLILFEDVGAEKAEPQPPRPSLPLPPPGSQVLQLQQELGAMREYLQSVIEEQESTNEELKSANEEILSANEELQSTNEELQTAKEESQSANEELATVNEELRHRNAELARVNSDLVNLLSGVGIPIIMVSRDLLIRRFTPPAEKLFNLIPTDVGRPISDIKPNVDVPDLAKLITRVIDSLAPYEGVVKDHDSQQYFLRVRPYVTIDKTIDGASIVLLDVNAFRPAGHRPKPGAG